MSHRRTDGFQRCVTCYNKCSKNEVSGLVTMKIGDPENFSMTKTSVGASTFQITCFVNESAIAAVFHHFESTCALGRVINTGPAGITNQIAFYLR